MPKLAARVFFPKLSKYIKGRSNHIYFTSCAYKKKFIIGNSKFFVQCSNDVLAFSLVNVLSNLLVRGISTYNFLSNKCYIINIKLNQICTARGACSSTSEQQQGQARGPAAASQSCEAQHTPVPQTKRILAIKVSYGGTYSFRFISYTWHVCSHFSLLF